MTKTDRMIKALEREVTDMTEAVKPIPWTFDPQIAIDLLFEHKTEEFPFQRAVYLYLFLVWCIRPGPLNKPTDLRPVAASAALKITFTGMRAGTPLDLSNKSYTGRAGLAARLARPWYQTLYEGFIMPVGGLSNAIHAPSLRSEDDRRKALYLALIEEFAIIEYIAKALAEKTQLVTHARVMNAMQANVLCKGDDFHGSRGEMRKRDQIGKQKRGEPARAISKTKFGNLWNGAPRTIILLWALRDIIGAEVPRVFSDPKILQKLNADAELLERLRRALQLYGAVAEGFAAGQDTEINAVRDWCTVTAPAASLSELPRFTPPQLVRFNELKAKHPAKPAGSRKK